METEGTRKQNNRNRVLWLLLILNLLVSGGILAYLAAEARLEHQEAARLGQQMTAGEKYVLYIGLNDKDTYEQEISTEEARAIVNAVCAEYTEGYTASDAVGGWVDETDRLTQEQTLVYAFYDITEEQLISIMDEVLVRLNQNTLLLERQQAVYTYYSENGTKEEQEK